MKPGMLRRLLATPAIVGGSLVVLLSAVVLGVSFSALRLFPPFGGRPQLGGALERSSIAPLTERFVGQVLGPGEVVLGPRLDPGGGLGEGGPGDLPGHPPDVVHPPTNNRQEKAYPVTTLPFTGRTSTAGADREAGEPKCGPPLGGTVWYSYKAERNEALIADTFGTGYRTTLAVYRQGSGGLRLLEHGCDFDSNGNSQVRADVTSGMTYLFQVGAAAQGGELTFHLSRFGELTLASVSTGGRSGNATSEDPSVSADGRYVAFASQATNLVPGMEARHCPEAGLPSRAAGRLAVRCLNVFLRDRQAGTTNLVSVGLDGGAANDRSGNPQVSDDGRFVLFHSIASNLVAGDTNDVADAFVRDMRTGRTERVSLSERGEQLRLGPMFSSVGRLTDQSLGHTTNPGGVYYSSMSADGRYVAFQSRSPDVVEADKDEFLDVFVRDRRSGTTRLVSNADRDVDLVSTSRNGRWIVLLTDAPMSERDGDLSRDVFVRDLWTGATELVSVPEPGHELEGLRDAATPWHVSQRAISDDGRFVVFGSVGALVDGDTNRVFDVFVRDRLRQATERVSIPSAGGEGSGTTTTTVSGTENVDWSISGDGSMVAFATDINYLEPGDGNNVNDVFVHDRIRRVTRRVSASGNSTFGSHDPQISGDGMHIAFFSTYPLSRRDSNHGPDVYVFSPIPGVEEAARLTKTSVPTVTCAASSEYARVGLDGVHVDVTPALIPSVPEAFVAGSDYFYQDHSVVRFKYRIDISGSAAKRFAKTADVGFELRWDNGASDYDFAVYDANGERLVAGTGGAPNLNNGDLLSGDISGNETKVLGLVPQCMDLRVDVFNYAGLPPEKMTLDITLEGLE